MGAEPEQLERDIARTRERLGRDVDALAEKVSPAAAAKRGVGRIRDTATSIRENVMGTVTEKASSTGDTLSGVGQGVSESAAQAKESVAETAQTVKRQAQGNPFAAGVIAFGVGWLVSSLIPATKPEEHLGAQIRETARDQAGAVKAAAADVVDDLREPAKQAAEQVKQTAADSAGTVKEEATGQASDLAGEAQDRGENVAQTARS